MILKELMNFFLDNSNLLIAPLALGGFLTYMKKCNDEDKEIQRQRKITIKKDFEANDISIVMLPPDIRENARKFSLSNSKNQNFNKKLLLFFLKLSQHFKEEDLMMLYKNIQDIIININSKKESIKNRFKNIAGEYYGKTNSIYVNEDVSDDTLFHELFHMATSHIEGNIDYCGFSQITYDEDENILTRLGDGLNEGYTEIMIGRYFNVDLSRSGYLDLIHIVEKVETILGKDFIENLYIHANLKGLIEELAKYSSVEEAMDFVKNLDFIYKYRDKPNCDQITKAYLDYSFQKIALYLSEVYKEKLKEDFYTLKFEPKDLIEKFESFSTPFLFQKTPKTKQPIMTKEKYVELYNSTCHALGICSKYDDEIEYIDISSTNHKNAV